MVVVPDSLRVAIDAALDAAYAKCPDAAVDRDYHYGVLVAHYDEYGVIPDFSFERRLSGGTPQ